MRASHITEKMEDPMMLQSAVRLPTPPPGVSFSPQPLGARKRSPPSRSPSPDRRRSPPNGFSRDGPHGPYGETDRSMDRDREQQLAERLRKRDAPAKALTEEEKQAAAKAEYEKLLNMRSGGTYIPPAKLRALQAQITDKTSKEYQRMAWEALKKSINGLINKVNVSNIKHIVPELFGENLVRGRGLFCRSIMKAQAASLPFTPIYAAMAAIVNTKLPQVGELLLNRLTVQFRKAFKRNDKAVCISSTTFIAHLCNQQVAHEMVAAQILLLLLHKPTDDSVEIAVGLTREVGQFLEEMGGPIALAVFDQFRNILHEADIDKRVQYMIEVLFQVRKDHYKDNPAIREELDLVEEEDQITHRVSLDDEIDVQDGLNIFKYDAQWEEHETAYKKLKAEILGEVSDEEDDDEEGTDDSSDEEEEDEQDKQMDIKDQSNTDLVNLRRTIYLTIMSSIDFEECCHKLIKITLPPGQESELPSMIIECCSQERTYSKFYGLIGERFAKLNRLWADLYEAAFVKYYETIHRYETNRLRNIAKFFGHMFSSDAIGWHALSIVHLNEEETTSSSRIFIKILFQELTEVLGMTKLQATLNDEILKPSFEGLFPTDNPRNTRFSINYFTSIGMGVLTEGMPHIQVTHHTPAPRGPVLIRAPVLLLVVEEGQVRALALPRLFLDPQAPAGAGAETEATPHPAPAPGLHQPDAGADSPHIPDLHLLHPADLDPSHIPPSAVDRRPPEGTNREAKHLPASEAASAHHPSQPPHPAAAAKPMAPAAEQEITQSRHIRAPHLPRPAQVGDDDDIRLHLHLPLPPHAPVLAPVLASVHAPRRRENNKKTAETAHAIDQSRPLHAPEHTEAEARIDTRPYPRTAPLPHRRENNKKTAETAHAIDQSRPLHAPEPTEAEARIDTRPYPLTAPLPHLHGICEGMAHLVRDRFVALLLRKSGGVCNVVVVAAVGGDVHFLDHGLGLDLRPGLRFEPRCLVGERGRLISCSCSCGVG
ncbi:pre-mRNA-splicing factor cwc22 [Paracoccidioides brasiliensis]|uniref:Pre-mRNA-splicing factor CWC22 n=1 Tax=Paracoccidioides brasiliensis TaxID=121759 RepID=A0A1D2JB77_PARBR|nr:pre-mRNA-splicing factor cwc22 [Paracoccidioides brasiliensis]